MDGYYCKRSLISKINKKRFELATNSPIAKKSEIARINVEGIKTMLSVWCEVHLSLKSEVEKMCTTSRTINRPKNKTDLRGNNNNKSKI